jgi:hypothetical protein
MIAIKWNQKTDQTDVTFSPDFNQLHNVAKVDVLGDALFMLNEEYVKALGETQDKYGKEMQND